SSSATTGPARCASNIRGCGVTPMLASIPPATRASSSWAGAPRSSSPPPSAELRSRRLALFRAVGTGGAEQVADAAAGVDERRPEPVELAPQVADVGLHHLRLAGVAPAPDSLQQLGPGQHAALVPQQAGEQPELGRGQVYQRSRPVHRPPGLVE